MSDTPLTIFNEVVASAVSMGASFTTTRQCLDQTTSFAFQIVWSAGATPIGTFGLEASNDDVNYVSIANSVLSVSGDTGNSLINVVDPGYLYVRGVYTRTSGDGTASVRVVGKKI